jgi:hypothetical protein
MGEESTLPTVEEAAEPPIRNYSQSNNDEPDSAGQPQNPQQQSRDDNPSTLVNAPHTLTATQVALALGVDIKYAEYVLLIPRLHTLLIVSQQWTQRH